MSKTLSSISFLVLGAVALLAFDAPAAAPPNLDRALAAQTDLAAQHPNDPKVLNDLGNLQMLAGQVDAAESSYRRALEIAPDLTSARYNLALLLEQRKSYREARGELTKVLEAEPDNAWAHYQLGAVYDAQGSESKAVNQYAAAFRLDPDLAFPEVNPHVIDNRYVTKAMLQAYHGLPLAGRAPKSYEDPSHIVAMMLPQGAPPTEAAGAPGAKQAAPAAGAPGMRPEPAFAGEGNGEAGVPSDEAERVLRQEDLQGQRDLNQTVTPGGTYIPPQGGTRVRTYPPGTSTPAPQNRGGAAIPGGRSAPARPGTVRPGGPTRYVPGIPSTGRLETELLPGAPADRTPAPAG